MTLVCDIGRIHPGGVVRVNYAIAAAHDLLGLQAAMVEAARSSKEVSPCRVADVNCDGPVNDEDLNIVKNIPLNTNREDALYYNPRADVTGPENVGHPDGVITSADAAFIRSRFSPPQ
jgi:hypothetical protein